MSEVVTPPLSTASPAHARTPQPRTSASTPVQDAKAEEKAAAAKAHREALLKETEALAKRLITMQDDKGVLIPLKTAAELDEDHIDVDAYITRVPTKCANAAVA